MKIVYLFIFLISILLTGCVVKPTYCGDEFIKEYEQALVSGDTAICSTFHERGYYEPIKNSEGCAFKNATPVQGESAMMYGLDPFSCVENIANATQNILACAGNIHYSDERCFHMINNLSTTPEKCSLLQGKDKEYCISYVAVENTRLDDCSLVQNESIKGECIARVAFRLQDVSICDHQESAIVKYRCYQIFDNWWGYEKYSLDKNESLVQEALLKITADLCSSIKDDAAWKEHCFLSVISRGDSSPCALAPKTQNILEMCKRIAQK